MKTINNNWIWRITLLIVLLLLLSTLTYAKPITDAFRGGLVEINNFFESENYKPFAKTIDFFFFALLFIAIYMMGARYAFKEVKRPEQAIVILLGLMTGFLLVLGGFSATMVLPYIHWLLYLLLFMLLWWLLKGIKSPFWRLLLALLLTLLLILLLPLLYDLLSGAESEGFAKALVEEIRSLGKHDLVTYLLLFFAFIIIYMFWWWVLGFLPAPLIVILAIILIVANMLLWL